MQRAGCGQPEPLGVTLREGGANVAVFSAHAGTIELCLFDASGERELERIPLPARTGNVHHGFVPGVAAQRRYGLRAYGPYEPHRGHRFNPAKLLVDPYAVALDRPFAYADVLCGANAHNGFRDDADSAPHVPKAIVLPPAAAPADRPARPRVPWADTLIYELHVRGFTRLAPGVPEALRGTCAGLAHPAAIEHLRRLGVTTVELLPIAAAIDERHLARLGLRNYWGYNPAAFLVPDPRLAPGGIDELRACVDALHAAGIEVLLDVVFNHTGEGDALGPTLSLRGLDNATYFRTLPGDPARYCDDAGCGNTLALDRAPVLRLVLDALRHHARVAGVDGFRFDLATTLARREGGFDPAAPLLQAIEQDPLLRDLKMIAEPWDVGPGGHRLGAFPAPWGEWNDRYRDAVRRYWRGDAGCVAELATRIAGSADVFAPRARPLSRSINYVAAHDGFTLADLVSHTAKRNLANGEDNRDGPDVNHSWNHGVEGDAADPAIRAARARDVRSLLATLLLSHGTPMLAMGDELGRTQHGNNNAYAQDSELTWVDWAGADETLAAFVAELIRLRQRHRALRRERALCGLPIDASGLPDVEWRRPDGHDMATEDWNDRGARALIAVLYAAADGGAEADRVVLACNAGVEPLDVRWPEPRNGCAWRRAIDTALPAGVPASAEDPGANPGPLAARSLVLLVEAPAPQRKAAAPMVETKVLDRLATAAGIAPEWCAIDGQRHVVGADVKRALLAAMGLGVCSTADARARLVALAEATVRRRLPPSLLARPDVTVPIALVARGSRSGRAALRLHAGDGTERSVPFAFDALPAREVVGPDGRAVTQRILSLPPLAAGNYRADVDGDEATSCRIVVAPERCYLPAEIEAGAHRFGLAAHLYTLRRERDQGIGDFTTLARIGAGTARAGGSILAIQPLHALFAEDRERASPYQPSDRRFVDPIYIDLDAVPDLAAADAARALFDRNRGLVAALSAAAVVDYAAVWRMKRSVLHACFEHFRRRPPGDPLLAEFERFVDAGGRTLGRFALFEAIAAAHPREPWVRWPMALRRPDAPGIDAFAHEHAEAVRFALYLQWLADRQFDRAASHARAEGLAFGLMRDLAIGAAPDGAESWASPDTMARGVSVGAPPDPFSPAGQTWGLPPPIPHAVAASGAAAFRDLLAANMRHAGALRIDHVMGLARLFWIPDGAAPVDGAYVDYPLDLLLGVLAQESGRARCLVIGEDLGTVPDGLRARLAAADVLSYRVLWFEREGPDFVAPARYPERSVTCVSTHDLPTVAGWWAGADIDERHALGLLTNAQVSAAHDERRTARRALADACVREGVAPAEWRPAVAPAEQPCGETRAEPSRGDAPHDTAVTAAVHRYAGATRSALVLLQADDLAGETAAVNLPGTDRERPNWRRKLRVGVAALWETPAAIAARDDFAATRAGPARASPAGSDP